MAGRTKGTSMIGVEADAELWAAFRAWAKGRGESTREALEMAMRRHMAYPPAPPVPPPVEPLPDSPAAPKPGPAKK